MHSKSTDLLYIPDEDEHYYQLRLRKERVSYFFKVLIGSLLFVTFLYFVGTCTDFLRHQRENRYNEDAGWFDDVMEQLDEDDNGLYSDRFIEFMRRYGRDYDSGEETMNRFKVYEQEMRAVLELNKQKKYGNVEFGENDMSDWTDEEFSQMLLPKSFYKRLRKEATFIRNDPPQLESAAPLPDFFDWREKNGVSPVKAQGKCGSCWAFAATATVESAWMIKENGKYRNLSEQTLLDCDKSNNACDGGDEDKAFRFIHRTGLAYSADLPYVAHRQNTCGLVDGKETTKIDVSYFLHQDEEAMMQWMVKFGPVNAGMSVTQPMRSYKCNTTECGVFTPDPWECKNKVIGLHAVLLVGYGTDKATNEKYWILKNSWGTSWGDEGFIKFRRGLNACGIEDEPVGILA